MKNIFFAIFLAGTLSSPAQTLVSATPLDTITAGLLNFVAGGLATYDVVTYKITYYTTDLDGLPTVASGAFCYPIAPNCDSLALLNYAHGTVLRKDDVPSRNNNEALIGKVAASNGYVSVMPDYLGLGDNPGFHPYLHVESQATASLDAILATREFVNQNLSTITLNDEVLFTGYSQGGHACMGTVKYIQDNGLESTFNITAAAPASGPYDLVGTTAATYVNDLPYNNPSYVVYLLYAMNEVYGNIFNSPSDILKSPYDVQVPPLMTGQNDMADVDAILPSRASQFLEDTVLQNFIADTVGQTHPIWQALKLNSNYDWTPQFPMRLYYCTQDEQVNYQNALTAASTMTSNGANNTKAINKGARDHGGCVLPSISGAAGFFDSLSTSCGRNQIGLINRVLAGITLYPNPATDYLSLEGLPANENIEGLIFNSTGQLQLSFKANNKKEINVAQLKPGVYTLLLRTGRQGLNLKLIIQ